MEELKQSDFKVSALDFDAGSSSCCRNLKTSSRNAKLLGRARAQYAPRRSAAVGPWSAEATSVPLNLQRHYKHKIRLVQPTFIRVIGRRKLQRVFD
jgi:hypothetical protein